jgi:hypothetical protein
MSIVHFLVRRFRSQLNSGHPKHEDGSIVLDPPISKLLGCTLTKRTVCDVHLYDIVCSSGKLPEKGKKRIYYFAGGSWQKAPSGQHWSLCARMAVDHCDHGITTVGSEQPCAKLVPVVTENVSRVNGRGAGERRQSHNGRRFFWR